MYCLIFLGHPESTWKATRHPPRRLQMKKMRMTKIGKANQNKNKTTQKQIKAPTKIPTDSKRHYAMYPFNPVKPIRTFGILCFHTNYRFQLNQTGNVRGFQQLYHQPHLIIQSDITHSIMLQTVFKIPDAPSKHKHSFIFLPLF